MIIKKRFISFIDILGFKDIITKNNLEDIGKLLDIIPFSLGEIEKSEILEKAYPNIKIRSSVFSDTIILFTDDDDKKSLDRLLISTSYLIRNALYENIALKGAVSYGELAIDEKKNLFYGQPIIDAYQLEGEVSYIGVVIHNSVEQYLEKNNYNELLKTNKIIEFSTPLKCGLIEHLNLNWFKMTSNFPKNKNEIVGIIKKMRMTCSGGPRKYYDNTLKILDNFYNPATQNL